ncbi:hypothetical protein GPLA_0367 [Paraglaciecola polaris LMG 21857]|uniref:Transposase n=1 Tax=Paraglaciecola polaris LMG 21857 TaxID=1129793 RepID=K6Z526_9ALTE|nr:hypothetical protein GPLA_0367 [Paraglaciecola polaris LMG 21857]
MGVIILFLQGIQDEQHIYPTAFAFKKSADRFIYSLLIFNSKIECFNRLIR